MLNEIQFWFTKVNMLTFTSRSQAGSQMNWHMDGTGKVDVRVCGEIIHFDEAIVMENGRVCHDKKRWRFSGSHVYFDRYRNDDYEQIFEFVYENGHFLPQEHYWCDPDAYRAELAFEGQKIVLIIYIHSARKNECLRYEYGFQAA